MIYPVIVLVVSLVFAGAVARQWLERRKAHQAVWSLALFMSALGSLFYLLSAYLGGEPWSFRLYYIFGALLMAAYLGLGSLYLVLKPAWANRLALLVSLLAAFGVIGILRAPVDGSLLARTVAELGPGTGVLQKSGWTLADIIFLNSFGTFALIGVALYSAWQVVRHQAPGRFLGGNLAIAVGAFLNAAAGTLSRLGGGQWFWLTMALGTVIIYLGFLWINRSETAPASARLATPQH